MTVRAARITFLQDQSTYIFDTVVTNNFAAANGRRGSVELPALHRHRRGADPERGAGGYASRSRPELTGGVGTGAACGKHQLRGRSELQDSVLDPVQLRLPARVARQLHPRSFLRRSSGASALHARRRCQIVDFRDHASGQFMIAAMNQLQTSARSESGSTGS